MNWLNVFSWVVIVANFATLLLSARTMLRYNRMIRLHQEHFERLIAFAGMMSCEESGAPENIREFARQALPPGTQISVTATPVPPGATHHVH